jgi:putative ATP-dependent endonuclease of OLD family
MYLAISLAEKAKSRDERLDEKDETETLVQAKVNWATLEKAGHSPEKLAALIYQPLYEKKASKAITAQYAAHLLCSDEDGLANELFSKLPPYLQTAISHLTTAP